MSAGYSGTPLPRKLVIKPGHLVALLGAPAAFGDGGLAELPGSVRVHRRLGPGPYDVILFFTRSRRRLELRLPELKARIALDGGIWVCWPKRASGMATDVTGDVVRGTALATGLVDVKVCAVDETWSGLRLVYRLEDRRGRAAGLRPRRSGPE